MPPVSWPKRWLLSTCGAIIFFAAATAFATSDWSVRFWQSDDGLPNNKVTSIAQTPDGYLWIATPTLLSRFDGDHFEIVSRETFAPGTMQRTSMLLRSRNGGLWLAMDHGPIIYAKSGVTKIFTNGTLDEIVQTLTEENNGALWITYRSGAVCRLLDGKIKRFTTADGLPVWNVTSLAEDGKGQLWFAKGGEFGAFQDEHFRPMFSLAGTLTLVRLAASRDGGIWICAGTKLFKFNGMDAPKVIGEFHPEMPGAEPTVLLEDRHGGLWIGTSDSGLFYFDGKNFENVSTPHREILSLLEDSEGNIWAGTSGGLDQIQPRIVALENAASGLPFDSLRSICEDANGNLWAATQNGLLACRSNNIWSTISTNQNWPGGLAMCVTADKSGAVWVGTQNIMLYCLRDGKFSSYGSAQGILSHTIHALLVASNGDLWIGGNAPESLQRLHDGKFENLKLPKDVGVIRTLAEDATGNIWVGSTKGALLRIGRDATVSATAQMNSTNSVRSLLATRDGSVWIGYAGWGLGRFKDGHFSKITADNGLADNYISQIVFDGSGWFWFGTDHGIFKVRAQELNLAMDNSSKRLQPIRYGRSDGLPSLQANFDEFPNSWRTRDGKLLMPMSSALAVVTPSQPNENSSPPPVLVNRVLVDDALVATYGGATPASARLDLQNPQLKLHLPPGHHRLEIDFAALNLSAPENVTIQYRLGGFDDRWIDAGKQRAVVYSQLAAGNYQFDLRARNGDGAWNEKNATLMFAVAPFLWQTWWFRFSMLGLFSVILIALVRYISFRRLQTKVRLLEQQASLDRERARIARDLHDHLGGTLTQMTLQMEMALRNGAKAEKIESHVQKSLSAARLAIQSLDETVWAVNPGNDTLPHLVNYIGEYAVDFLDSAGIRCRADLPEILPAQPVPADVRHNLFLAIKESLNNVVRHANASEVFLHAHVQNSSLKFSVADNGRGFDPAKNKLCADGLQNMRQRMRDIGGEFEIESTSEGTKIFFICPWQNGH